ncbi:hypothetical protein [Sulfuriflexus mobilis]|uniref:hypothetical protein n=1 Tax=Sulfuriflexus mobilis TaxID=1811807 RepID=UPI000F827540|nr:hypothetical protein [Sulfuriflexus mobilis]
MKRVATIILNRNLPDVTDKLCDHLSEYDGDMTDIFVVEAGSDVGRLSRNMTWHADWPDAIYHGLRFPRGMNFGLSQLWKEGKFKQYDAFFLLTNDTELEKISTLNPLMRLIDKHPRMGILSPCGKRWGEKLLLQEQKTKYFWFIHNNALLLRREFIEDIINIEKPDFMSFLFDGINFRGYGSEHELIAKSYANDWAAAITSEVLVDENESYLINQADLIKTEGYEENLRLYIEEGQRWMRNKYGFNSHWAMQQYVKSFYDRFFDFHPEFKQYQI